MAYRDDEEALSGRTVMPLADESPDPIPDDPPAHEENIDGVSQPMPVWLIEASKDFRWHWVPLSLRKAGRSTVRWLRGPQPPHTLLLKPLFPHVQEIPVRLLNMICPKRRYKIIALLFVYFSWFLSWSLVLRHSVSSGPIDGYGKPSPLGCGASFWSPGNSCGLNGYECRPFSSSTSAFRCPAFCSSKLMIDEYVVGNHSVSYKPLVIGGPPPNGSLDEAVYRADSFLCQAATHAGVISDQYGGCGVVELTGAANEYHASAAHGYRSIGFPSTFPKSFRFLRVPGIEKSCRRDLRWPLFAITATAIVIVSLFTTSPAVHHFTTFFMLIVHVGLVSDPPGGDTMRDMVSLSASRILPASFIAYVLYLYCARPLLAPLSEKPIYQLSKTVLYFGPAFTGALNNYTFAIWIPIQRLTPHDIKSQPGAPVALGIMITIVMSIILSQAWFIRQGGLFFHYLKIYLTLGAIVLTLLVLPGFRLRIHHYILAILLMPGTAFPTRPSIFYQGLLLGLFVNGIARWGFASIIETPAALGELPSDGNNPWWGAATPNITNDVVRISLPNAPAVNPNLYAAPPYEFSMTDNSLYRGNGNITFSLFDHARMDALGVDGVSVLVNDVERWRGFRDEDPLGEFIWHRRGSRGLDLRNAADATGNKTDEEVDNSSRVGLDEQPEEMPKDLFFRFAFLKGSRVGIYGGVGVWNADGSWVSPPAPRR